MKHEAFSITPKTVLIGTGAVVKVRSIYASSPFNSWLHEGKLRCWVLAVDGVNAAGAAPDWAEFDPVAMKHVISDRGVPGGFELEFMPEREGEYSFRVEREVDGAWRTALEFGVYALKSDLYALKCLKGDLHVHSNASKCGSDDEDPRFVTAVGRRRGLDFMTLSDHMQLKPSVDAHEFWKRTGSNFKIYNGEEVHMLLTPTADLRNHKRLPHIHIVNFGGDRSVAQYENEKFDAYTTEVDRRADAIDHCFDISLRRLMAGTDLICDKIHEYGGLAIFCHPFWTPMLRWNLPDPVREYMLKSDKFDAMEVVGLGAAYDNVNAPRYREGNQLCIAWWQQESIRRGKMIPLVGTTDSHRAFDLLGRQYTLVFAADNTRDELISAIRAGRSVAVQQYPGEYPAVYGDFRLVRLASFLLREYFPEHDAVCEAEGGVILEKLRTGELA